MQDEDDFDYTGSEWQRAQMRRAIEPTEEEAGLNRIPRQEKCNPESWLNGNKREGDRVGMACAGCGWYPATCAVVLSGEGLLPEPDWPFDYKTCPLCALREERDALKYSSRDPLTERAERLAAARKGKK